MTTQRSLPRPTFWQSVFAVVMLAGLYASYLRFFHGLGAATNLTDGFPWGLWIGFDVLCGVGLAAGGFTTTGGPVISTAGLANGDSVTTTTSYALATSVPPRVGSAFSRGIGGGGFAAYHFEIVSRGTSQRNALEQHTQGLYLIGPGSGPTF